jgi:lipopolysaccharide export system permease protein
MVSLLLHRYFFQQCLIYASMIFAVFIGLFLMIFSLVWAEVFFSGIGLEWFVWTLVSELPYMITIVLPFAWFLAVLVTDQILKENGESLIILLSYGKRFYHQLWLPNAVIFLILLMMHLWVSPQLRQQRYAFVNNHQVKAILSSIRVAHFDAIAHYNGVVYAQGKEKKQNIFNRLFFAKPPHQRFSFPVKNYDIMLAGHLLTHISKKGYQYLVWNDGHLYHGVPGDRDYRVSMFKQYIIKHKIQVDPSDSKTKRATSLQLWKYRNQVDDTIALQWRINAPLSFLLAMFWAIRLIGKQARQQNNQIVLIKGLLGYSLYQVFMTFFESWSVEGLLLPWLAVWMPHLLFFACIYAEQSYESYRHFKAK